MSASDPDRHGVSPQRPSTRALRWFGWTLIAAGAVVLLYVVYALWLTGIETSRAQDDLARQWDRRVEGSATPDADADAADTPDRDDAGEPTSAPGGPAVARLEFARPGSDTRPVSDDPLFVVDGVGYEQLRRGPGHYPDTAAPGAQGNFAVAGHRTTYGAPFYSLDELRAGDEVRVTDGSGQRHVYRVVDREVVSPTAGWVLRDDPLATDRPTLTLTTCHPRFSARQRLVVFAELEGT